MDWKPIETAPKDGTRVLLWPCLSHLGGDGSNRVNVGYFCWGLNGRDLWVGSADAKTPTHWMPLPEPPHD